MNLPPSAWLPPCARMPKLRLCALNDIKIITKAPVHCKILLPIQVSNGRQYKLFFCIKKSGESSL